MIIVDVQIVTPLKLYLNLKLVFGDFQLWRLVTNCLYLGRLSKTLLYRVEYFGSIPYNSVFSSALIGVNSEGVQ